LTTIQIKDELAKNGDMVQEIELEMHAMAERTAARCAAFESKVDTLSIGFENSLKNILEKHAVQICWTN